MSKLLLNGQYRVAVRICAVGTVAALMSGCSADATRLGDPFGNPFSSASNDTPAPRHLASNDVIPAGRTPPISSQALAPRAASVAALPPRTVYAARGPVSHEVTGSIAPATARASASAGAWTTTGGTPIQVAEGESATLLSTRYGVPEATLLQVNGLHSAAEVRPGSRIVIPVYGTAAQARVAVAPRTSERVEAAPAIRPAAVAAAEPARSTPHAAREHLLTAPTRTAAAPMRQPAPVKTAAEARRQVTAEKKVVADVRTPHPESAKAATFQRVAAAPVSKIAAAPVARVASIKAPPVQQVATRSPAIKTTPVVTAKAVPAVAAKPAPVETAQAPEAAPAATPAPAATQTVASADGSPEFRWPARGRIIQGFKGGSGGNDGINIALPEGTSVKAAEGGVVAYAGSELKGYGNLVLIRHPNGFVSAYANNGEIDVKRGETVKRGQQIAKSGQSGNVSSPQLHFELRKGSTPVDPTQFLAGL
jgi:murein DD-endopeptidase MepM/ murein hydrolase activator NlpD